MIDNGSDPGLNMRGSFGLGQVLEGGVVKTSLC
jgi:hypothetical protein